MTTEDKLIDPAEMLREVSHIRDKLEVVVDGHPVLYICLAMVGLSADVAVEVGNIRVNHSVQEMMNEALKYLKSKEPPCNS